MDAKFTAVEGIAVAFASSAIDNISNYQPKLTACEANIAAPTEDWLKQFDKTVDIVMCTEVLEHLTDPGQALKNLLALNPSRGVVISVPNGRVDQAAQHIQLWSPETCLLFIENLCLGWTVLVKQCKSPGSPSGFDNMAVHPPKDSKTTKGS